MVGEKFLIDANILITPYKTFYPFDFAPSFWSKLSSTLAISNVAILDKARDEIAKGTDDLSLWLSSVQGINVCSCKAVDVITRYGEILNFLNDSPLYSEKALREWSNADVADPWLVAAASTYGYSLITFEQSAGPINPKSPCGRAKIPDVGREFGVQCRDLYYFMRKMDFVL